MSATTEPQVDAPSIDDTQPLRLAQLVDTANRLTVQRDRAYDVHVAPIDYALRSVREQLFRMRNPEKFCVHCGKACNVDAQCPTPECPNYSGIPF